MKAIHVLRAMSYVLRSGFTLLELLVSIGIFVIITTAVVLNFRVGERSDELRLATERFASGLRGLSTMAQTGQRAVQCDTLVPKGGYGVQIQNGTITFFADCDGKHTFDTGETLSSYFTDLPPSVSISPSDSTNSPLTVTFEPPVPAVWINGQAMASEAQIILTHTKTLQTKTVTIKRISGRIEVE